ncbi:MAG: dienelactone hydrolase family protein [Gammaproteobacteria bacterium]|nr:dienelactone hydrolase family protein [Gammaproteobacteria bacterium]
MLQTIEINPKSHPTASVIWLHGLGASGYDFVDIVPLLNLSPEINIHFVFPHAPVREVAYAGNAKIRAWFNVIDLDRRVEVDEEGIRESQKLVSELIAKELEQNVPSHKIALVGFSQGGVMALQCGLRYPEKLAGILSLSAWLPLKHTVTSERSASNQQTPILMQHGVDDELIPLAWAEESRDYLQQLGYNVMLDSYPMRHTVCPDEISVIGNWLGNLLC